MGCRAWIFAALSVLLAGGCTNHLIDRVPAAQMQPSAGRLPLPLIGQAAVAAEGAYHGVGYVEITYGAQHVVKFIPVEDPDRPVVKSYNALFWAAPKGPCQPLDSPSVRGGNTDSIQILAFRGTADGFDWTANLTVGYVILDGTGIRFHPGFLQAATDAIHDLGDEFIEQVRQGCPLLIVGHSKGGATAVAAYLILAEQKKIPLDRLFVITFGQPVVTFGIGGPLGDRIVRVIHAKDPVPMVPVATRFRYRPLGAAIYLWEPEQWSFLPRSDTESERWDVDKAATMLRNGFEDHNMITYKDRALNLKIENLTDYDRDRRYPK